MLNFGPQHPAAHGILRIGLAISGEVITRADLQFGLLHRGSEKLSEARSFAQIIPYVDRMDYVANLIQEHSAVLALESLVKGQSSPATQIQVIRVICDELSRVLNHLLTMSAICLDMGAMGPIFWAFEERELIMEVFERSSGARMHTALYRVGGVGSDFLIGNFTGDILVLLSRGARAICGAFVGLITNRSLKSRLSAVGSFSLAKVTNYGITGVIARASGLPVDSRLGLGGDSYSIYPSLPTRSFLGKRGDSYDRFMVRAREMLESYKLVSILIPMLGDSTSRPFSRSKFSSMESVIDHFKSTNLSSNCARGLATSAVEGPKGLVCSTVLSSGSFSPYRFHLRSPVAHNLHLLETSSNHVTFADFVATFCSLDVVLGEIDR